MSSSSIPVDSASGAAALCAGAPRRSWQQQLKDAVRDPAELCRLVGLPSRYARRAVAAAREFPVFAPRSYIARMRPGDPLDPLLRQVLPLEDELHSPAGYRADPLDDRAASVAPGLLHKYRSRILMVTTGACAVHCRYCFRRHFPYEEVPRSLDAWADATGQIAADSNVREVILSGGDPLTLVDSQLAELARRLARIDHVRQLRIHTRLPIMIPERVTDDLVAWLRATRLVGILVIHANHANELDESVADALARLSDAGIVLLNQSVLLKGVNDHADTLAELSERLVDLRVMPYYLHQLDRVTGAAHFEVSVEVGRSLVAELRRRLPGYAVPRYVQEIAGQPHKIILA
jgi:EF-P beta-lysylation protein EpmB